MRSKIRVNGTGSTYDADGNLTYDGVWSYTWDGENRLIEAQNSSSGSKLEFAYDYRSRRVQKKVLLNAVLQSDHRFVYDQWNVVAEIDALNSMSLVRTFTWGLDVSNSLHGAGGVGGLLMISEGYAFYLPIYDANGNVHGLIKNGGTIAAAYGYTVAGEKVQAVGSYADDNPIRFASKWYDTETGLYQYNHRYYSPSLGRFISRDPIAENGGLNLYAYAGNDPVNRSDYLGLFWTELIIRAINLVVNYAILSDNGGGWGPATTPETNTATWRAAKRYSDTFGGLGTPIRLRYRPLAIGAVLHLDGSDEAQKVSSKEVIDREMTKALDEAFRNLPGLIEKAVVLVELFDEHGNSIGFVYGAVNAHGKYVTLRDRQRALEDLGEDVYRAVRNWRDKSARVAAEGHTHPGNAGPSAEDVEEAIRTKAFGLPQYLRLRNGKVYIVNPGKEMTGFDSFIGGPLKFKYAIPVPRVVPK